MSQGRRIRRRWLALPLLLTGCEPSRQIAAPEEAPYKVQGNGQLVVRADLMPQLEFACTERSELTGELVGVGRIGFAPGAAYAVRPSFGGLVETVQIDLGQQVVGDQVLATIHSGELAKLRAEVRSATAALLGERDALARTKVLVESGTISNRRQIELEAKIESLEAQRKGLQSALKAARVPEEGEDLYELRASRAGEVIKRRLDPGEQVRDPDNEPAFVIADPTKLVIRADFPERDAPLLREGLECSVQVPSVGENQFPARVLSVVRAIDSSTQTVKIVCGFAAPEPRLRADMLARVTVDVKGEPRLLVPRSAVMLRRDARVVFVRVGERTLERRPVTVGTDVGSRLEILSGLQEGDQVVTKGATLLDGELDRLL